MASEYDDDKLNDAVSSQQLLDYELRPHSEIPLDIFAP